MQNITPLNISSSRTVSPIKSDVYAAPAPRPWMQDFWLWILLVGPLVAPLFLYLQVPILRPFADGIYLLGRTICPKVGVHFMFLGYPMAVCSSCWAAVWGLWSVRLLYGRAGEGLGPFKRLHPVLLWNQWRASAPSLKIVVVLAGFIPWALDVMMWDAGIWASPHPFMMFAGFMGGFTAGLLLLPAASEMRDRVSHNRI